MLGVIALAAVSPAALTPDGWGRLRIGMTRAQVVAVAGAPRRGIATGPDPDTCEEFRPRRAPAGMIVMIEDGRLARIAATRPGLRTGAGISVGDPERVVRRAHPRIERRAHTYADPPAADLTWWRDRTRGMHYEIGPDGRVAAIRVGGPAIRYVEGCL